MCTSGWKKKRHQRKLQPVTTTMCASGELALVDRRITPQVQEAKVRAQGAKVRTIGAKVRTSISASQKGVQQRHSTTTTNNNNNNNNNQDQHSMMQ